MSERHYQPQNTDLRRLSQTLREIGFDIEPPRPGDPPDAGIVARRDLGERVVLLTVDSGGRFRIEVTWTVAEHAAGDEIAGVPVRVVETTNRAVSIAGQVAEMGRMTAVIEALGALVTWASRSGTEPPVPPAGDDFR